MDRVAMPATDTDTHGATAVLTVEHPVRKKRKPLRVIVPTQKRERAFWTGGALRVVGVDEVGVAPTCGAVVAAAVIMPPNARRISGVRDSKTLSAAQRERLEPIIRRRAVALGVGAASVVEIDRINIYHATHLAMRRAIARIGQYDHVLVDGLRIAEFEEHVGPYTAIVDGDALCYSISCASIVAKVVRDRMMALLAARYPHYGWEHNCGYATAEHRAAIREHGLTPFHRRSFPALRALVAGEQQSLDLFPGELESADDELDEDAGPMQPLEPASSELDRLVGAALAG
jgi:ribonuclease HII